jgi:hypothetical protein
MFALCSVVGLGLCSGGCEKFSGPWVVKDGNKAPGMPGHPGSAVQITVT